MKVERALVPAGPPHYPRQSVVVDGMTLNYVTAGSGRPVVLIHGNPGSHEDYTLAVVGRLSQSYYVLAFDRPGHGYSERQDSVQTTVEVQALIIRDALQKLALEKPVLVGHSWGGSLVLASAVAYGKDLAGIVLLAPAAYPSVSIEWWSRLPDIPLIGNMVVNTLTPFLGRAMVKKSLRQAYAPQDVQRDYVERSLELWMKPDHIRACACDERTLGASLTALSEHYRDIELPVVIVTGSADRLLKPEEHAYPLHQAIKNSKLVVLPETGHQLPQTRPDAVSSAIDVVWAAASKGIGKPW
ncbi:MAG TPA: alpha/beta hydrolase [Pyrinomonadaceae bacterium]|nr:alpha/beta hydrolase [Pyrinomonadaceae bacterium]